MKLWAAFPRETRIITAAMPIPMPMVVNMARSLFANSAVKAIRTFSDRLLITQCLDWLHNGRPSGRIQAKENANNGTHCDCQNNRRDGDGQLQGGQQRPANRRHADTCQHPE